MKKRILLAAALFAVTAAGAQTAERQVLGSAGVSFTSADVQADYTLGETITFTGTAGSFSVTQGFHQNSTNPTAIKEQTVPVRFALYPNPAQDQVTLSLNVAESFDMKLSLSNLAGQVLLKDESAQKVANSYNRTISLQQFASGVYFINLYGGNNTLLQSIRFVKQ